MHALDEELRLQRREQQIEVERRPSQPSVSRDLADVPAEPAQLDVDPVQRQVPPELLVEDVREQPGGGEQLRDEVGRQGRLAYVLSENLHNSDETLSKVHNLEGGSNTSAGDLDSLDLPLLRGMTFKTFDPKYLPNLRKEALENAMRGMFDKLLMQLRDKSQS